MVNNFSGVLLAVSSLLLVSCNRFELRSRIARGYNSHRGQFPYFAFLEIYSDAFGDQVRACGGSLISDRWVITAAHCLKDAEEIDVHLGELSVYDLFRRGSDIIHVVEEDMHMYPNYFEPLVWNDIGLINLPEKPRRSPNIQPIQLPTKCETNENVEVIAMGNGAASTNTDTGLAPILQFALLNTTTRRQCREQFPFLFFRRSVICAVSDYKQSVCHGDSGGGLVRVEDNTLIGIASFIDSVGCEKGLPQAFTNILRYTKWISQKTGLKLPSCSFFAS